MMQQVWSEIYHTIYLTGEDWWLNAEGHAKLLESNKRFKEIDPFEELFASEFTTTGDDCRWTTISKIAAALNIPPQSREFGRLRGVVARLCKQRRAHGTVEYFCARRPAYSGEIQQPVYDDGVPF